MFIYLYRPKETFLLEEQKAEVPKVNMPGFFVAWVGGNAETDDRGRFCQTRGNC